MVDNFNQIKGLLKFNNEYEFYFLQIIQRKKDHKDSPYSLSCSNNNRTIKSYYIYSIEQLDKYKLEIIELCRVFTARAGITLNKRDSRHCAFEMMELLAKNIKNNHFNQLGNLYSSVVGLHYKDKDKTWLIDIDEKKIDSSMLDYIDDDCKPKGEKLISIMPTKNGYHLIVKPFDIRNFGQKYPKLDIHKNNPTILYIP